MFLISFFKFKCYIYKWYILVSIGFSHCTENSTAWSREKRFGTGLLDSLHACMPLLTYYSGFRRSGVVKVACMHVKFPSGNMLVIIPTHIKGYFQRYNVTYVGRPEKWAFSKAPSYHPKSTYIHTRQFCPERELLPSMMKYAELVLYDELELFLLTPTP